jgi:membrane-bound lytic murein transglycosylase A
MTLSPLFRPMAYDALPGWGDDDPSHAFAAFRRSAFQAQVKPYKTGLLGLAFDAFQPAYAEARTVETLAVNDARDFFERRFVPALIAPGYPEQAGLKKAGFVTGFYEPEVEASAVRTPRFNVPVYSRPADLVDVDDANRPKTMDPCLAFARQTAHGLVEYHERSAIDGGVLEGLGLEIAWLADKVDLFFVQVQGAAKLRMVDGAAKRITYAAKSGQRFTAIGSELVDMGELQLHDVTMQSIRAWLKANPARVDELLWRNRSYVFFRETEIGNPDLGPVAAAKVQLTAGRSVAVDRSLHTFGTPFYVNAPQLKAFGGKPFQRLMIAQDTGSAIVGPARGDLFAGSGDAAGEIAGVVRAAASFYALVPRALL